MFHNLPRRVCQTLVSNNSRKQNKANYFGSSTVNDEIEEENEFEEEGKINHSKPDDNIGDTGGINFQFHLNSNVSKDSSFIVENVKSKSVGKRKTIK